MELNLIAICPTLFIKLKQNAWNCFTIDTVTFDQRNWLVHTKIYRKQNPENLFFFSMQNSRLWNKHVTEKNRQPSIQVHIFYVRRCNPERITVEDHATFVQIIGRRSCHKWSVRRPSVTEKKRQSLPKQGHRFVKIHCRDCDY